MKCKLKSLKKRYKKQLEKHTFLSYIYTKSTRFEISVCVCVCVCVPQKKQHHSLKETVLVAKDWDHLQFQNLN